MCEIDVTFGAFQSVVPINRLLWQSCSEQKLKNDKRIIFSSNTGICCLTTDRFEHFISEFIPYSKGVLFVLTEGAPQVTRLLYNLFS